MTALSKNKPRALQSGPSNRLPVAAGTQIFEGAAVGVASGYMRPLASGDRFAGFARRHVDNRRGAAGALEVDLITSGDVQLVVSDVTIANLGDSVYATDDDTFVLGGTTSRIGEVKRVPAPGVAVVQFNALLAPLSAAEVASTQGTTGSPYRTKGSRERLIVNGNAVDISPIRMQIHDLKPENGSLIDPVTGRSNFSLLNLSQALVPIPGATSAPYWTDPGPLLYTVDGSNDGFIPAEVPGQLEFVTHTDGTPCVQFSCPPGYGEGAAGNGKRRIQLQTPQFSTRQGVEWDMSFLMPPEDAAPYDQATGYNYPLLLWQAKTDNSQPFWLLTVATTADPNVYRLRMTWLYSDHDGDLSTYRRQYNDNEAGQSNSKSANTLFDVAFNRNEFQDLRMKAFLDERDITQVGGGEGYMLVTLGGETLLQWSGPTVAYKDIDGNLPAAPRCSWGLYLYEYFDGGVPAGLDELDLNRQTDPAPHLRRILFRRGRMLQLQPVKEPSFGPVYVGPWAACPLATAVPEGSRAYITDIGNQGHLELKTVSGAWRLKGSQVIYLNETQAVGSNASTAEQVLFTTPGIPRSFLAVLRYYEVSFLATKSGATTTAQILMREGNAGDLTDTSVYTSQALLGTTPGATARAGSGGTARKYNSTSARTQGYTTAIHVGTASGASTTSTYPVNASAVLTDALVYQTVAAVLTASGSDVPALERIQIMGF